jgi:hypothetical protein
MYTHNEIPEGKITEASEARMKIAMEKPHSGLATKNKLCTDYLRNLIDNKNLQESKIKLLISFIENKIDYRNLL